MKNKNNYLFKLTLLFFVLTICLILNSCKSCKKENVTLKINEINETLYVNEPIELSYTSSTEDVEVTWEVSDNKLAEINGNTLTPLKEGTITISIFYNEDTTITDSCVCTIKKRTADKVEINIDTYTMIMGESIELSATVYPLNVSQEVTWSITDNQEDWEVAELSGTTLTALKYGKVYLTAQSKLSYNAQQTIIIEVFHPLLEDNETFEAKYIRGAFGEDASSMYTIQYTTYNKLSYALVTTADDPDFLNAKKYYGEGYYFEDLDELLEGKFEGRNIWRIEMTDLNSSTDYIYKINKGNDTYSDVYSFTTAGNKTPTSFLFITDTHYYTGTTGTTASAAVSEEIVKQALIHNPNISFIMDSGDLIDTGGNSKIWDIYFDCADSLKQLPFISVPGNHEYYFNNTGQKDNSFFKIYNPGPNNGPSALAGSTGWFKHNDTLFILVDNVKGFGYDEQMKWMADLLENQEYKYSVIMFHIPVHNDNTDYDENFIKLFDKYSVDLVLSGHYHSEKLVELYNNSSTSDPYLGTAYLTGAYSGIKGASSADSAINTARGYMIDITDDSIKIKIVYANGNLGKEWTITNRECKETYSATKEELINSINYTYNEETNSVTFDWSKSFFGNVKKLYINETNRNELSDYVVFPTSSYTSYTFNNVIKGYDYNFEMKLIFEDGTETIINKSLSLHEPINLKTDSSTSNSVTISFDPLIGSMRYEVYKFDVYIVEDSKEVKVGEFKYLQNSQDITSFTVNNLDSNKEYTVIFKASDRNNKEIYFTESINIKTE